MVWATPEAAERYTSLWDKEEPLAFPAPRNLVHLRCEAPQKRHAQGNCPMSQYGS
jgi:hypothetical protein